MSNATNNVPIALQLYTVRDQLAEDFEGTVRKVAEMGYEAVELAGDGGLGAEAVRKLLDDCGLKIVGSHTGIDALEQDLQKVVEDNKIMGNPNVVIPYLAEDRRGDAEAWKALGRHMNDLGRQIKEAGLQLCYHNHAFEFEVEENGAFGLDLLYANADADLVQVELDTYWVRLAGQDPAAYLQRYASRTPLVHIKDMTAEEPRTFTEVGTGIMTFSTIFEAADPDVLHAWIVEQDVCQRPSLESAKISLDNLRQMLGR